MEHQGNNLMGHQGNNLMGQQTLVLLTLLLFLPAMAAQPVARSKTQSKSAGRVATKLPSKLPAKLPPKLIRKGGAVAAPALPAFLRPKQRGPIINPDVQIPPSVLYSWIKDANSIKEEPPYLLTPPAVIEVPPPCRPGAPRELRPALFRSCVNNEYVTYPDYRAIKVASQENRLALVKHYVQKFNLAGFGDIEQFTPNWLTRKSAPGAPGADDFNATVGMIRYSLILSEEEFMRMAKYQVDQGDEAKLGSTYKESIDLAASASAEDARRQRRMLDFWYPDGPIWTGLLVNTCRTNGAGLPPSRCCFLQLGGCLPR
jgi:hypothetical protein